MVSAQGSEQNREAIQRVVRSTPITLFFSWLSGLKTRITRLNRRCLPTGCVSMCDQTHPTTNHHPWKSHLWWNNQKTAAAPTPWGLAHQSRFGPEMHKCIVVYYVYLFLMYLQYSCIDNIYLCKMSIWFQIKGNLLGGNWTKDKVIKALRYKPRLRQCIDKILW